MIASRKLSLEIIIYIKSWYPLLFNFMQALRLIKYRKTLCEVQERNAETFIGHLPIILLIRDRWILWKGMHLIRLCRTLLMHLIRLCMKYVLIRMIFYYSILYMFYVEWIYDVLLFSLQMRSIVWFIHAANVFLLFSLLFWVIAKEDNFDNGKTTSFYSFMIKTSYRIQISIATYLFAV